METLIEMEGHVQIESDKEHGENLGWISPELVDEYRAQFTASGCNASGCDVTLTTLDKNTMQAWVYEIIKAVRVCVYPRSHWTVNRLPLLVKTKEMRTCTVQAVTVRQFK